MYSTTGARLQALKTRFDWVELYAHLYSFCILLCLELESKIIVEGCNNYIYRDDSKNSQALQVYSYEAWIEVGMWFSSSKDAQASIADPKIPRWCSQVSSYSYTEDATYLIHVPPRHVQETLISEDLGQKFPDLLSLVDHVTKPGWVISSNRKKPPMHIFPNDVKKTKKQKKPHLWMPLWISWNLNMSL
jgi:hypothetical protein